MLLYETINEYLNLILWGIIMIFEITKDMEKKISDWDSCKAIDVTGAKFAYTFIPTGIGLVIKVQCDICNRILDLTED
jgi:hypothetical protein